jgi:hypothetical protein
MLAMSSRVWVTASVAAVLAIAIACGGGGSVSGLSDANPEGGPGGDVPPGTPPGAFGDAAGQNDAPVDAPTCTQTKAEAKKATRPVDIIFVIDNSLTMKDKITTVETQISTNLVGIVDAAKIDYRVILLSAHGTDTVTQAKVCIKAPLSGTSCSPIPAQPVETARFFHHSIAVGSNDAFCAVLNGLDTTDEFGLHPTGYASLLRAPAFKVFIVLTDDRVSATCKNKSFDDGSSIAGGTGAGDAFDSALTLPNPALFGDKVNRNYIWHSIVGLTDFDALDTTKPSPPSAPITTTKCSTAFNPGTGYQGLSVETGGLRYPICGLDYSAIFAAIASSTITGAALACEFEIPAPPPGKTLDLSTVVPHFTPSGGGPAVDFRQVKDLASCARNGKEFYIADGKIELCPDTCAFVQSDSGGAQLDILYGCDPDSVNAH